MSLSRDVIANMRYRVTQNAREIDTDPSVRTIVVRVQVNTRNHQVLACQLNLEREYDPAPPGVAVREALDNP